MAKKHKGRLKQKKNNDNLLDLFITCIYEHVRFSIFKDGPDLFEIKDLLLFVYGQDVALDIVAQNFIEGRKRHLVDMHQGKLTLTTSGRNYFHMHKRSIIPPQTVAQLQQQKEF